MQSGRSPWKTLRESSQQSFSESGIRVGNPTPGGFTADLSFSNEVIWLHGHACTAVDSGSTYSSEVTPSVLVAPSCPAASDMSTPAAAVTASSDSASAGNPGPTLANADLESPDAHTSRAFDALSRLQVPAGMVPLAACVMPDVTLPAELYCLPPLAPSKEHSSTASGVSNLLPHQIFQALLGGDGDGDGGDCASVGSATSPSCDAGGSHGNSDSSVTRPLHGAGTVLRKSKECDNADDVARMEMMEVSSSSSSIASSALPSPSLERVARLPVPAEADDADDSDVASGKEVDGYMLNEIVRADTRIIKEDRLQRGGREEDDDDDAPSSSSSLVCSRIGTPCRLDEVRPGRVTSNEDMRVPSSASSSSSFKYLPSSADPALSFHDHTIAAPTRFAQPSARRNTSSSSSGSNSSAQTALRADMMMLGGTASPLPALPLSASNSLVLTSSSSATASLHLLSPSASKGTGLGSAVDGSERGETQRDAVSENTSTTNITVNHNHNNNINNNSNTLFFHGDRPLQHGTAVPAGDNFADFAVLSEDTNQEMVYECGRESGPRDTSSFNDQQTPVNVDKAEKPLLSATTFSSHMKEKDNASGTAAAEEEDVTATLREYQSVMKYGRIVDGFDKINSCLTARLFITSRHQRFISCVEAFSALSRSYLPNLAGNVTVAGLAEFVRVVTTLMLGCARGARLRDIIASQGQQQQQQQQQQQRKSASAAATALAELARVMADFSDESELEAAAVLLPLTDDTDSSCNPSAASISSTSTVAVLAESASLTRTLVQTVLLASDAFPIFAVIVAAMGPSCIDQVTPLLMKLTGFGRYDAVKLLVQAVLLFTSPPSCRPSLGRLFFVAHMANQAPSLHLLVAAVQDADCVFRRVAEARGLEEIRSPLYYRLLALVEGVQRSASLLPSRRGRPVLPAPVLARIRAFAQLNMNPLESAAVNLSELVTLLATLPPSHLMAHQSFPGPALAATPCDISLYSLVPVACALYVIAAHVAETAICAPGWPGTEACRCPIPSPASLFPPVAAGAGEDATLACTLLHPAEVAQQLRALDATTGSIALAQEDRAAMATLTEEMQRFATVVQSQASEPFPSYEPPITHRVGESGGSGVDPAVQVQQGEPHLVTPRAVPVLGSFEGATLEDALEAVQTGSPFLYALELGLFRTLTTEHLFSAIQARASLDAPVDLRRVACETDVKTLEAASATAVDIRADSLPRAATMSLGNDGDGASACPESRGASANAQQFEQQQAQAPVIVSTKRLQPVNPKRRLDASVFANAPAEHVDTPSEPSTPATSVEGAGDETVTPNPSPALSCARRRRLRITSSPSSPSLVSSSPLSGRPRQIPAAAAAAAAAAAHAVSSRALENKSLQDAGCGGAAEDDLEVVSVVTNRRPPSRGVTTVGAAATTTDRKRKECEISHATTSDLTHASAATSSSSFASAPTTASTASSTAMSSLAPSVARLKKDPQTAALSPLAKRIAVRNRVCDLLKVSDALNTGITQRVAAVSFLPSTLLSRSATRTGARNPAASFPPLSAGASSAYPQYPASAHGVSSVGAVAVSRVAGSDKGKTGKRVTELSVCKNVPTHVQSQSSCAPVVVKALNTPSTTPSSPLESGAPSSHCPAHVSSAHKPLEECQGTIRVSLPSSSSSSSLTSMPAPPATFAHAGSLSPVEVTMPPGSKLVDYGGHGSPAEHVGARDNGSSINTNNDHDNNRNRCIDAVNNHNSAASLPTSSSSSSSDPSVAASSSLSSSSSTSSSSSSYMPLVAEVPSMVLSFPQHLVHAARPTSVNDVASFSFVNELGASPALYSHTLTSSPSSCSSLDSPASHVLGPGYVMLDTVDLRALHAFTWSPPRDAACLAREVEDTANAMRDFVVDAGEAAQPIDTSPGLHPRLHSTEGESIFSSSNTHNNSYSNNSYNQCNSNGKALAKQSARARAVAAAASPGSGPGPGAGAGSTRPRVKRSGGPGGGIASTTAASGVANTVSACANDRVESSTSLSSSLSSSSLSSSSSSSSNVAAASATSSSSSVPPASVSSPAAAGAGSTAPPKRARHGSESALLAAFNESPYLNARDADRLVSTLNLTRSVIMRWFRNQRYRFSTSGGTGGRGAIKRSALATYTADAPRVLRSTHPAVVPRHQQEQLQAAERETNRDDDDNDDDDDDDDIDDTCSNERDHNRNGEDDEDYNAYSNNLNRYSYDGDWGH